MRSQNQQIAIMLFLMLVLILLIAVNIITTMQVTKNMNEYKAYITRVYPIIEQIQFPKVNITDRNNQTFCIVPCGLLNASSNSLQSNCK